MRESAAIARDSDGPLGIVRSDRRIDESAFLHRQACVDETVTIGARSRVWQFASVVRNASIGEDCSIASCAIVDGSEIGDRCIISHGAFIDPGIRIENDVFVGPHVSLCNDVWPRADKNGFQIDAFVSGGFVTTRIEDGASLGANVVLLPGVVIGAGCMISAGTVVRRSVPAAHLLYPNGDIRPIDPGRKINRMRRADGESRG